MVYAISMYSHEVFIFNGYPVDAFYGLDYEPWPPNWTAEEEARYWKTIEGEQWCKEQ